MNPSSMTPPEVDTILADLWAQRAAANIKIGAAIDGAHHATGETPQRTRGGGVRWAATAEEALDALFELAKTAGEKTPWDRYHAPTIVAGYEVAVRDAEAATAAALPYEAEYARRRWSRFFLVTSSNGHIHQDMHCSTCYVSTGYGWLPELSGLTEADAVDAHGPLLCSVCYPSASAEWTTGIRETPEQAEANGKCLNRDGVDYRRAGQSLYGNCPTCGARGVAATERGLRKHTHQRRQDEAEQAARRDDPKLIGTPTGDVLKVGRETYRTVRTAEIAYVDAMWWANYARTPEHAAGHEANAAVLIQALAAKAGVSPEEMTATLAARVARKIRQG